MMNEVFVFLLVFVGLFVCASSVVAHGARKEMWHRGECDYYGNPLDDE